MTCKNRLGFVEVLTRPSLLPHSDAAAVGHFLFLFAAPAIAVSVSPSTTSLASRHHRPGIPRLGRKTAQDLGVGRRVASPGIESGWFALLGGRCSTQESAIEAAIQAGRQKIDLGFERGSVAVND
jgi:hypothetical protein